jgi:arylsulfatase A-like enzyme
MNILFITIDQWRADWLGANGSDFIQTPHLDALAKEGVLFSRHYTNSAPCGPSRATLHTGMYPSNHRSIRNGTPLNETLTNIALEARKAGYSPTLFGYTDTSADPRYRAPDDPALRSYEGILPGFDVGVCLSEDGTPWLSYLKEQGYSVNKMGYDIYHPDPSYSLKDGEHVTKAPTVFKSEHSETAWLTQRALEYMTFDRQDKFFCHLSYLRPHPPFIASPDYHLMYRPSDMKDPIDFGDADKVAQTHPFLQSSLNSIRQGTFYMTGTGLTKDLEKADVQQIRATYSALVSEVDNNIGALLFELKETGKYDDTLIVVTADHGEQLGDHHLFGKLGFYDQSFHIPLIIKPPASWNGIRGHSVQAFTESVDVTPTILDLIGLPIPAQCDGRSLSSWLKGEIPDKWRDAVHWLYDFRDLEKAAIETELGLSHEECSLLVYRDESFKYVHFAALPPLLFDLQNDPDELHNLAEEPDYQAVVLIYAQKLLSWRMSNEYGALDKYLLTKNGLITPTL